jgi:hypothetical protein
MRIEVLNASRFDLPADHSQMRSFWYGLIHDTALKGRKYRICRTFSAELTFPHFQTFHAWLWSFSGFAAKDS